MIEINLLPVDEQVTPRTAQKGLGFEVPKFIPRGFGAAIVVLLIVCVLAHLKASSYTANLASSKQTLSELENLSLEAQRIEAVLPDLTKRAEVFQTRLENRKVWSELLHQVALCCPQEIQLTEIKLSVPRSGMPTMQRPKELLVKGFYLADGSLESREMTFRGMLQKNENISQDYHSIIVANTEPEAGRTKFTIRCTEQ